MKKFHEMVLPPIIFNYIPLYLFITYLFMYMYIFLQGFPGGSAVKNPSVNTGTMGLIPGLGRSPGEENDNPLQYSSWRILGTEEPGGL